MMARIPSAYWLIAPAVIVLLLISIYPLLYSLNLSFRDFNYIRPHLGKPFIGLQNYKEILTSSQFYSDFWVTVKFVVGSVFFSVLFGLVIALLLNRTFRWLRVIRALILLPMITAPVVVALIWRWLLNPELGLVGYLMGIIGMEPQVWLTRSSTALPVLVCIDAWEWAPYCFLIIFAALQSLPDEPYEAALVDGAGYWQTLFYITLPQLKPIIIIVIVLRTLVTIKIYDLIYILTAGGPGISTESLVMYVYKRIFIFNDMGKATASSFIVLIISIVVCRVFFEILTKIQEKGK
ncbi:MAG: sugar ABC transporter permease [Desulfobacterales bacterium]|nr:sugar ABC transporter permease [Desulfobacterales bacterium]